MKHKWANLLLPVSMAVLAFGAGSDPVHNDKVSVSDITLKPGKAQSFPGNYPAAVVYFTDGTLEIGGTRTSVKRGDTVFQPKPAAMKNIGSAAVHFARVEFLGAGLPETWGTTGLSPNYKLLWENPYGRAYDIRIPAGTREPQHTHHDRVVVCLSGAQLKHLMPDGREEPSTLKTGEIVWRRGGTHIGQNLGKTDLWVIAVEPK